MILLRQPPDIVRNKIQYHGVDETISGGQTGPPILLGRKSNIMGLAKQYRGVGETISGGYCRARQYLVDHCRTGDWSNGILNTV